MLINVQISQALCKTNVSLYSHGVQIRNSKVIQTLPNPTRTLHLSSIILY